MTIIVVVAFLFATNCFCTFQFLIGKKGNKSYEYLNDEEKSFLNDEETSPQVNDEVAQEEKQDVQNGDEITLTN